MRISYLALLPSVLGYLPSMIAFSVTPKSCHVRSSMGPLFDAVLPQEYEKSPTQQKVRTMASYLVSQLLEKALLEATKEKSKISEGDALALLETLQNMSSAKKSQDNLSTAWQAAEKAVESNGSVQEVFAPVSTEPVDTNPRLEDTTVLSIADVDESSNDMPASATPIQATVTQQPRDTVSSNVHEIFQRSLLAARIRNDAESAKRTAEMPIVDSEKQPAKDTPLTETMLSSIELYPETLTPRIPDVISKDFGKPLEVTAWDVPPLSPTSIPQKSPELSKVDADDFQGNNPETLIELGDDTTSIESNTMVVDDSEGTLERFPANQSQTSKASLTIMNSSLDKPTVSFESPEAVAEADTKEVDVAAESPDATSVIPVQPAALSTSTDDVTSIEILDEPKSIDDLVEEQGSATVQNTPVDGSPLVDGDKYKDMSLEEKAFAILTDLGMVETRNQPLDPGQVKAKAGVEENAVAVAEEEVEGEQEESTPALTDLSSVVDASSTTDQTDFQQQEEEEEKHDDQSENRDDGNDDGGAIGNGIRKRVVEPIRSFLSQPRSEPMFSRREEVTTTTATRSADLPVDLVRQARQQPKSPEEEAKLAAKYASIEDLGDRAFAILKDLGMVG